MGPLLAPTSSEGRNRSRQGGERSEGGGSLSWALSEACS